MTSLQTTTILKDYKVLSHIHFRAYIKILFPLHTLNKTTVHVF